MTTAIQGTLVGGRYNTTPPAPAAGDAVEFQADANGYQKVVSGGTGLTADQVQGNVAGGATDAGNPVKVGAKNNTTRPTYTDGQRTDLQSDTRGNIGINVFSANGTNAAAVAAPGDGASAPAGGLSVLTFGENYNGATYDRQRNNLDTAALVTLSAAAATTTTSADQTNYNARGVLVAIDVTAGATETMVVTIQGKDAASGKYYTLLTSASLTTSVATTLLTVYPGCIAAANTVANLPLPRVWRVSCVGSGGGTITMTVGASVIL